MVTETKKADKNYTISLLRFMAMIFIVLCHFLQYYGNELAWWFYVGVQMFFCISGFLYATKRIKSPVDFICKNLKKILIPYYCFLIPVIILYFFFAKETISVNDVIGALLSSGTISGIKHLWFIPYILFCYIITPYLQAIADKMLQTKWFVYLGMFFLLVLCGQILSNAFNSYFVFSRIFCYLFGYFASIFLQKYESKLFNLLVWILTVATIMLNALRIYCKYIVDFSFKGFYLFEQYSHSLLGISIVFLSLILIKNVKKNKILDLSDKYSFYVYIVHQLFILSSFNLLTITKMPALNCCITVVVILFTAALLKFISDIITRCYNRVLNILKTRYILNKN